jgi:hypothetical protein
MCVARVPARFEHRDLSIGDHHCLKPGYRVSEHGDKIQGRGSMRAGNNGQVLLVVRVWCEGRPSFTFISRHSHLPTHDAAVQTFTILSRTI